MNSNVQILSTVIAIVVSLSLIAVQLASQAYTPRIMRMYVKQRLFWVFIGQFIFTIAYNLLILNALPGSWAAPKLSDISVFLTLACLLALFPHVIVTIEQLQPEAVIYYITREMDQKYADALKKWVIIPEDPLTTLEEIFSTLIQKGDITTVSVGLSRLRESFFKFLNKSNEEDFSHRYSIFLKRVGVKAINENQEEILIRIVSVLTGSIKELVDKDFETANRMLSWILKDISSIALDRSMKEALSYVVRGVGEIAVYEAGRLPKEDDILIFAIRKKALSELKTENAHARKDKIKNWVRFDRFRMDRVGYLREIGVKASKLKFGEVVSETVSSLQEIFSKVVDQEMGDSMKSTLCHGIMQEIEQVCLESNRNHLRNPLVFLGVFSVNLSDAKEKGLKFVVSVLTHFISRIYLNATENGLCDFLVINNLGTMGRTIVPEYVKETVFIVETLGKIGELVKDKLEAPEFMVSEKAKMNLTSVIEEIKSIETWKEHSNKRIIKTARSWLNKLQ